MSKLKKKTASRKKRNAAPKSGLSGFVVIWRHTMDDVPIGMYANEADALRAAKTISFKSAYKIAKALDIDCSTPICFGYVTFTAGVPSDFVIVDRKDDR